MGVRLQEIGGSGGPGPSQPGPAGASSEEHVALNLVLYFLVAPTTNVLAIVVTEGVGPGWRYVPLYYAFTGLTWVWAAPTVLAMLIADRRIPVLRPALRRSVMVLLGAALFSVFALAVFPQPVVIRMFAGAGSLFGLLYRCRSA